MSQTKKILTLLPTLRAQLSEMERERDAARTQLTSARTLILNIKIGNIYQEPADECERWLNSNPETVKDGEK